MTAPTLSRRKAVCMIFGILPLAACANAPLPLPAERSLTISGPSGIAPPRPVEVSRDLAPGQILVVPNRMALRFVTKRGQALEYPVALGKAGFAFTGNAVVGAKRKWPSWTPTPDMLKRDPEAYGPYREGMPGGPENPLGARALYLFRDGQDTLFRIHGTDAPDTIGKKVSNGCIRMHNTHVIDLFERVKIGAPVQVVST